ncbi:MAG: iron ABC transporter permease [Bacteroidales bacterium]|jgi:iron complex transport system permease protein|nr:iron ABC transporter permease [Bacteroidales bacterium]
MKRLKYIWILSLMALVLGMITVFSFTIGRYSLPVDELLRYIFTGDYTDENLPLLVMRVRLPRILIAILAGGALSVSGAAYQGLFRNPVVSPDILGVSSGAGFGAAVAIMLSAGIAGIQVTAFVAGLIAVALSLSVSRVMAMNHDRLLLLVLSGMIVGAMFTALTSLMKYLADSESRLPEITFWLMGSLTDVSMREIRVVAPLVLAALVPLLLNSWKLNILSFGDEEAKSLGVNAGRLRLTLVCCASLLTASVVSVTGIIGWVGLIIPHFTRFFVGADHRRLLPASFLVGAAFLLLVDDLARSVSSLEIPLGVITALIGAPMFFLALRMAEKK